MIFVLEKRALGQGPLGTGELLVVKAPRRVFPNAACAGG